MVELLRMKCELTRLALMREACEVRELGDRAGLWHAGGNRRWLALPLVLLFLLFCMRGLD